MNLLLLIIDFGMMLLIWLVQVIIYPVWLFMEKEGLVKWHQQYTSRIFIFVFPLMTLQLVGHVFLFITNLMLVSLLIILLILSNWWITFAVEVPKHNAISRGLTHSHIIHSLITWNKPRTFLWTGVFLLQVYQSYQLFI